MKVTFMEGAVLAWSNPEGLLRILQAESRGMANSLNPLDHPWNFDSAMVAKHRLRAITRTDRRACDDGKWTKVSEGYYFEWPLSEPEPVFVAKKPRYRWERRR